MHFLQLHTLLWHTSADKSEGVLQCLFQNNIFIHCIPLLFSSEIPLDLLVATDPHPAMVLPYLMKWFRIKRGNTDVTWISGGITSIKEVIPRGEEGGNTKNILLQFQAPAFSLGNSHFCMLGDNPSFCDLSRSICSFPHCLFIHGYWLINLQHLNKLNFPLDNI